MLEGGEIPRIFVVTGVDERGGQSFAFMVQKIFGR